MIDQPPDPLDIDLNPMPARSHPGASRTCPACHTEVVSREFLGVWMWTHSSLPDDANAPEEILHA